MLGRLTLGLAVIVAAGGALIDELNGGRLHPEQWLGAAAMVCGLGLLVGAVRGRARWLVLPALVLAVAGYGSGLLARTGIGAGDIAGERYVTVHSDSPSRITSAVGFGMTTISVLEAPRQPVVVDVSMAVGDISVAVGDDIAVELITDGADHVSIRSDGRTVAGERVAVGPDRPADVVIDVTLLGGTIELTSTSESGFVPGPVFRDVPIEGAPAVDQVIVVAEGVGVTPDGHLVLGNREAIVSPDLELMMGQGGFDDSGTFVVDTSLGQYRIKGDVLVTPTLEIFDLREIGANSGSPD